MGANQQMLQCVGASGFMCDAADFDGTNDYMTRGAALTGQASSKLMTFSGWFAKDSLGASARVFQGALSGVISYMDIVWNGSDIFQILAKDVTQTTVLNIASSAHSSAGAWFHVAFSVDMSDTGKRWLYINGVSELTTVTTYTDAAISFASCDNYSVGAAIDGSSKFDGGIAELAFWPGVYLDLSVAGNLAKLISGGKPVNMGSDASTPTGTAAIAYQHLTDDQTASGFATNSGTGGNFSITGTLTTYATSPSG